MAETLLNQNEYVDLPAGVEVPKEQLTAYFADLVKSGRPWRAYWMPTEHDGNPAIKISFSGEHEKHHGEVIARVQALLGIAQA